LTSPKTNTNLSLPHCLTGSVKAIKILPKETTASNQTANIRTKLICTGKGELDSHLTDLRAQHEDSVNTLGQTVPRYNELARKRKAMHRSEKKGLATPDSQIPWVQRDVVMGPCHTTVDDSFTRHGCLNPCTGDTNTNVLVQDPVVLCTGSTGETNESGLGFIHPSRKCLLLQDKEKGEERKLSRQMEEPIEGPPIIASTVCMMTHEAVNTATLVSTRVLGRLLTAIVDTGASLSCISLEWFNKLPQATKDSAVPASGIQIVDAQSNPLVNHGQIVLPVTFPNETWSSNQTWQIIDNLPYPALLGVDFLYPIRAIVDFNRGILKIPITNSNRTSLHVPIWWFPGGDSLPQEPQRMFNLETLTLLPDTSYVVACAIKVANPEKWIGHTGLVSLEDMTRNYQLGHVVTTLQATNPALVDSKELTSVSKRRRKLTLGPDTVMCQVFITNFSDSSFELSRGTEVGVFTPLHLEDTITLVIDPTTKEREDELRSDLGLFSYYRLFVENFSQVAEPLTQLLGDSPQDKLLIKKLQTTKPPVEVKPNEKKCKETPQETEEKCPLGLGERTKRSL
jgi:hypothetical protein